MKIHYGRLAKRLLILSLPLLAWLVIMVWATTTITAEYPAVVIAVFIFWFASGMAYTSVVSDWCYRHWGSVFKQPGEGG